MKALCDGDIFAYRCAAAAEKDDEGIAKYYVDKLLDDCLIATESSSYEIFISGRKNFRFDIYPEYKANRLDVPKPRHLAFLRDYLLSIGAVLSDGCEADDLMGVAQCGSAEDETVIVSLDKDMLTIPGWHYSWEITGSAKGKRWVKDAVFQKVDHLQALRWFYTQCITGDTADNIKGVAGMGKVGAKTLLSGCETEQQLFDNVRRAYDHDDQFIMNARCLYIWQKQDDDWMETFNRLKGEDNENNHPR